MSAKPKSTSSNNTTNRRKNKPSTTGGAPSSNSLRSGLSSKGGLSARSGVKTKGDTQSLFARSIMKLSAEPSSNNGKTGRSLSLQRTPKKQKTPEGSGRKKKPKDGEALGPKYVFKEGEMVEGVNSYKVGNALRKSVRPSEIDLYVVEDVNGNVPVRMKVGHINAHHLKNEAAILQKLAKLNGDRSFVSMLEYGSNPATHIEYLFVSPYGMTVHEIMKKVINGPFSLECAIAVGLQMLKAITDLHSIGFIHRNIRPAAFNCGVGPEESMIMLQEFRVARKYEDNKKHVPMKLMSNVYGTGRFGARNCQAHKDQGRKDDLESWLYSLFYMIDHNTLNWKKETNSQWVILQKDIFMKNQGKEQYAKAPKALEAAVTLINEYEFASEPNYELLKKTLLDVQNDFKLNTAACDWKGKNGLMDIDGDTARSFDNRLTGDGDMNGDQSKRNKKKTKPTRKKLNTGDIIQSQANNVAWKVVNLLGSGGFGDVYKVHRVDQPTSKCYALKTESEEGDKRYLRLKVEVTVMMKTAEKRKSSNFEHFVEFVDRGKCEELKCKYVVMGLVGPSLEDIRSKYLMSTKFSPATSFNVSIQTVIALRDLHSLGYLHRDIKPANYAVGLNENESVVYMLDFGIAKLFIDPNGNHKTKRKKVKFLGTLRYASRACMEQVEQGRKDDLETWIYLMFDIFDGEFGLPWKRAVEPKEIHKAKKDFFHQTAVNSTCPKQLVKMGALMQYINQMDYETTPDYDYIINFVKTTASDNNIKWEKKLDWIGKLLKKEVDTESDRSEKKQSGDEEDQ